MKILLNLSSLTIYFSVFHSSLASNTEGTSYNGQEYRLMLKIAREYRDGSKTADPAPNRAVDFYQHVINQAQDSEEQSSRATAAFELYRLLEEYHPKLSSVYSHFELLTFAANAGHAAAQHDLAAAYATGYTLEGMIPMDATRALLLEYSAALSGDLLANMAMGYRYSSAIGLSASSLNEEVDEEVGGGGEVRETVYAHLPSSADCEAALPHYEFAANIVAHLLEGEVTEGEVTEGENKEVVKEEVAGEDESDNPREEAVSTSSMLTPGFLPPLHNLDSRYRLPQTAGHLLTATTHLTDRPSSSPYHHPLHPLYDLFAAGPGGGDRGTSAAAASGSAANLRSDEIADYYAQLARSGDSTAAHLLGSYYLHQYKSYSYSLAALEEEEELLCLSLYYLSLGRQLGHGGSAGLYAYFVVKLHVYAHPFLAKSQASCQAVFDDLSSSSSPSSSPSIGVGSGPFTPLTARDLYRDLHLLAHSGHGVPAPPGQQGQGGGVIKMARVSAGYGPANGPSGAVPGPTTTTRRQADVHGLLAYGLLSLYGVVEEGSEERTWLVLRNVSQAVDCFAKIVHVHPEAGYLVGEIRLGRLGQEGRGQGGRGPLIAYRDLPSKRGKKNSGSGNKRPSSSPSSSSTARGSNKPSSSSSSFTSAFDLAASFAAYSASASLQHPMAQHRLAHLLAKGFSGSTAGPGGAGSGGGITRSCELAVGAFKAVAEKHLTAVVAPLDTSYAEIARAVQRTGAGPGRVGLGLGLGSGQATATLDEDKTGRDGHSWQDLFDQLLQTLSLLSNSSSSQQPSSSFQSSSSSLGSSPDERLISTVCTRALLRYTRLAVAGVEVAQFNAAHLIAKLGCQPKMMPLPYETAHRLLLQREADQQAKEVEVEVKMKGEAGKVAVQLGKDVKVEEEEEEEQLVQGYETVVRLASTQWPQPQPIETEAAEAAKEDAWLAAQYRAFQLVSLSASQGYADSLVLLGDYYYYGLTSSHSNQTKAALLPISPHRALAYYQRAADLHHLPALFNLAVLYQSGIGVDQDFHLAKRYYDLVADAALILANNNNNNQGQQPAQQQAAAAAGYTYQQYQAQQPGMVGQQQQVGGGGGGPGAGFGSMTQQGGGAGGGGGGGDLANLQQVLTRHRLVRDVMLFVMELHRLLLQFSPTATSPAPSSSSLTSSNNSTAAIGYVSQDPFVAFLQTICLPSFSFLEQHLYLAEIMEGILGLYRRLGRSMSITSWLSSGSSNHGNSRQQPRSRPRSRYGHSSSSSGQLARLGRYLASYLPPTMVQSLAQLSERILNVYATYREQGVWKVMQHLYKAYFTRSAGPGAAAEEPAAAVQREKPIPLLLIDLKELLGHSFVLFAWEVIVIGLLLFVLTTVVTVKVYLVRERWQRQQQQLQQQRQRPGQQQQPAAPAVPPVAAI